VSSGPRTRSWPGARLLSHARAPEDSLTPRALALRCALSTALVSRAFVGAVAAYASLTITIGTGRQDLLPDGTPSPNLYPFYQGPFEHVANLLLSPLARWDAGWYLNIANDGYVEGPGLVFFPLYPLLVWLASGLGARPELILLASYGVSLVAFTGALYLVHRLVQLEFGRAPARPVLLVLAFFPGALYFGIPYTESLFLFLTVAAFYAARTGHWAWAGLAAGLASGTRSQGIILIAPLVVMYLWGPRADREPEKLATRWWTPRYRLRPSALWLALTPAGIIAFSVYCAVRFGDATAYSTWQEKFWGRTLGLPLQQVWTGLEAAAVAAGKLAGGYAGGPVPGHPYDYGTLYAENLLLGCFLVFALVALVGTFRRLPAAYGVYAAGALAIPLSYEIEIQPLLAFQRYSAVVFPLFVWLGLVVHERRVTERVVAVSAILLGGFTAQFATWHWWV
jgi:hypothetical protein